MGRKRKNHVYKIFHLLQDGSSKCKVCNKVLKSQHGANLLKHLKVHKDEYEDIKRLNEELSPAKQPKVNSSSISDMVIAECTNLIAIHGRPLTILNDEAFKKLIWLTGTQCRISPQTIRQNIKKRAADKRLEIANELKGKQLCLKTDVVSNYSRSYLGINVQFVENGKIVLRNLAMVELLSRHTADYVKEQLLFALRRYSLDVNSIYSITVDSGANILKMSPLLSHDQGVFVSIDCENQNQEISVSQTNKPGTDIDSFEATSSDTEDEMTDIYESSNCVGSVVSAPDSCQDYDDGTEIEYIHIPENTFSEVLSSVLAEEFIQATNRESKINVVRCAAHTIQLAVQDACQNTHLQEILESARNVVRRLIAPNFTYIVKESKKKLPILDCPTRWNSTLDMVERLIQLKEICDSNPVLQLSDDVWNYLQELQISLEPAKKLIKMLQGEQMTMGDFLIQWLLCKFELKRLNTTFATSLCGHMETREIVLHNNDAFLNAVFLDPRVNSTLSEEQKDLAKNNLKALYTKVNKKNCPDFQNMPSHSGENAVRTNIPVTTDVPIKIENIPSTSKLHSNIIESAILAKEDLKDLLNTSYIEKHDNVHTLFGRENKSLVNIENQIRLFLEEPLLQMSQNALDYWENKKHKFPELYKLASIVLGAPASQVSVRRLFSSLKFVVTNLHYNLKPDRIEDILFLRSSALYN